ncbi:MAG: hypothetical protein RLZZ488_2028 [Pseudomonadota bacterium]|jgi:hypothetical protein
MNAIRRLRLSFFAALMLFEILVLQACKPKSESVTQAVPACTVWPSHFMVTKVNTPVFESIDNLEENKNAKYVGKGIPVIRELTILNQDKDARLMKIIVRGGSLAGSQRWWTLASNLDYRTKAKCPENTPRKCSEHAVHFCDGSGCRCIDAGPAPDSEVGNLIIETIATGGLGPVAFGARALINNMRAVKVVPAAITAAPIVIRQQPLNLVAHRASEATLQAAETFLASSARTKHSIDFVRARLGKLKVLEKIDFAEASAINFYTRMGHYDINAALRTGDDVALQKFKPLIEAACSGLSKMVDQAFVGTVYRGTNLTKEVSALYQAGARVTEFGFTSTTRKFGEKFSGNTMFVIKSKTGRMIDQLSTFENEAEVLFAPGTVFRVISRVVEDNVTKILMEQITP